MNANNYGNNWRAGLEPGSIYVLDDLLRSRVGSYSSDKLELIKNYNYVLPYRHSGDGFSECLLIKKDGNNFIGTDIDTHSFGFYNYGRQIVYKCTKKEMYQLLAGLIITTNAKHN